MVPPMTEAATRVLQSASRWAIRAAVREVRSQDLLQGLLEEEEGRPWMLLSASGLDPRAVRQEDGSIEAAPSGQGSPALSFAPLVLRVFDEAVSLARSLTTDRLVATDTLLLALLREDVTLRLRLEEMGLAFNHLERTVLGETLDPLQLEQPLSLAEMTERVDAARALDASANRAREALRVLEDYCRFCLDDAFLTEQLKTLRHELRAALDILPAELLLSSRETLRDVGTTVSTAAEKERHSLREVAQANGKRLQEALRSLEEFGKLLGPEVGGRLEQLRYRSYTLERALFLGVSARERLRDSTIQVLLTGSLCNAALDWTIAEAAAGGAQVIQLREKNLNDRELLERARNVRRWTHQAGLLFIVNDRPDIARLVEADGVHLGQEDLPVKEVRRIVGPELLIGVSTHNIEQVRQAILDGASYLGVGPLFPSKTKDFSHFPGLEFLKEAAAETSLPLFAIGGINPETLQLARQAGARRIAVSAAVCQADEPRKAVALLKEILNRD